MKLKDLLNTENNQQPITTRYSKALRKKYQADLQEVVDAVADGQGMPAATSLREYFMLVRHMNVSEGTIRRHLKQLQNGATQLWAK